MNSGISLEQIHTAKEIFPSLFLQYGGKLADVEIARCIFENNFDSAIVSRSLERKVLLTVFRMRVR